jgi:uncharacterized protein YneF (UPF0154 family)
MYKIIGADQKEYGPVTADQLRQWIAEGRVNSQTKVQAAGAVEWKSVADLPEFAAALPRLAPPLPGHAPAVVPAAKRTSPMALWALITGIISLFCCLSFLAPLPIVLGAVALSQLKHHPEQNGAGLAIAGIILGCLALLVGITGAIIFITTPQLLQNLQNAMPQ